MNWFRKKQPVPPRDEVVEAVCTCMRHAPQDWDFSYSLEGGEHVYGAMSKRLNILVRVETHYGGGSRHARIDDMWINGRDKDLLIETFFAAKAAEARRKVMAKLGAAK